MMEPREVQRWERNLTALIVNAGEDDPEGFAEAVRLIDTARARLANAAARLQEQGYSWRDLARALGVTRSAAAQRFRVADQVAWSEPDDEGVTVPAFIDVPLPLPALEDGCTCGGIGDTGAHRVWIL